MLCFIWILFRFFIWVLSLYFSSYIFNFNLHLLSHHFWLLFLFIFLFLFLFLFLSLLLSPVLTIPIYILTPINIDNNEWICGHCGFLKSEDGTDLVLCDGPCLRSFHLGCLDAQSKKVHNYSLFLYFFVLFSLLFLFFLIFSYFYDWLQLFCPVLFMFFFMDGFVVT